MRLKVYASILLFSLAFISVGVRIVFSQTETPTPTPQDNSQAISDLQNKIKDIEDKLSGLKQQDDSLSSQISIMNNQINLTELRIESTKEKIRALGKDIDIAKNKVSNLEDNIGKSTKALIGRVAATYQIGSINPWEMLLTSDSISNFMTRLTYLKVVQVYDKKSIYTAEQAKNDYNNQKQIFEDKQKEQEAPKGNGAYCSNIPLCDFSPPQCPSCTKPMIIHENDSLRFICPTHSNIKLKSCPACDWGVLIPKVGVNKTSGKQYSFSSCHTWPKTRCTGKPQKTGSRS